MRIAFGGTNTHLANIDCKTIKGPDGTPLSGDMAARILDIAGIVLNRNTIPGDKTALNSSGIRFGTPWMTQRGLKEADMLQVADCMADILFATTPYTVETRQGPAQRAKVDFNVLEETKLKVRAIAEKAGIDFSPETHGYPHFYYLDDSFKSKNGWSTFDLTGEHVLQFVNLAFSSDIEALQPGQVQPTQLVTPRGTVQGSLALVQPGLYRLSLPTDQAGLAATFLRALSDGYIAFDPQEIRRLPGPISISESSAEPVLASPGDAIALQKPYFIGCPAGSGTPLAAAQLDRNRSAPAQNTT